MAADSAFDDLSRVIIRAQHNPNDPPVKIKDTGPRPPVSAQSQRQLTKPPTKPRRLRRRHPLEGGHSDGDDDDGAPPDEEPPHLPLLMRIEDVMRELSISRRTVYELVKYGKLHLVRIGIRGSRIRTEEVLQLAGVDSKPLRVARLRNQGEDEIASP